MATPELRVLCALADPSDQTRFATDGLWQAVQQAAGLYGDRINCERLDKVSETGLQESLAATRCNLLHFVGHAECRTELNYTSIALETSSGQTRNLNGKYFASLLSGCPTLKTVVLQAADKASFCFDLIARALIDEGLGIAVMLPPLTAPAAGAVHAKLYQCLLAGADLSSLETQLQSAHPGAQALRVLTRETASPVVPTPPAYPKARAASANRVSEASPVVRPAAATYPLEDELRSKLHRKREDGLFDVFLCHNSTDKQSVISIARKLRESGILPWLDIWELPPGKPWQPELERQIPTIKSAAVFVGAAGVGPWQEEELYGFLDEFVSRRVPVIPVLLPDVAKVPPLPIFLRRMVWVDFRLSEPDPFQRLVWGITGQRPAD